jgi:hypothetical protein
MHSGKIKGRTLKQRRVCTVVRFPFHIVLCIHAFVRCIAPSYGRMFFLCFTTIVRDGNPKKANL